MNEDYLDGEMWHTPQRGKRGDAQNWSDPVGTAVARSVDIERGYRELLERESA